MNKYENDLIDIDSLIYITMLFGFNLLLIDQSKIPKLYRWFDNAQTIELKII